MKLPLIYVNDILIDSSHVLSNNHEFVCLQDLKCFVTEVNKIHLSILREKLFQKISSHYTAISISGRIAFVWSESYFKRVLELSIEILVLQPGSYDDIYLYLIFNHSFRKFPSEGEAGHQDISPPNFQISLIFHNISLRSLSSL